MKKGDVLTVDAVRFLGYGIISLFIIVAFWNMFVSDIRETTVAEEVQMYLQAVAAIPGSKITYYLPQGNCELEITKEYVKFKKSKAALWNIIVGSLSSGFGGYIVGGGPGVVAGIVIGGWLSYLSPEERIPNPVGSQMVTDNFRVKCNASNEKPIFLFNENGYINIRSGV